MSFQKYQNNNIMVTNYISGKGCPQSQRIRELDTVPKMHNILQDMDKCDENTLVPKLTILLNMVTTADVSDDFQTCGGPQKVLDFIDSKNKKISKLAFCILGQYGSRDHEGNNADLLNMRVFGILSKTLEDFDALSYNHAQSALFFLSSIVALSKTGQLLVRKSKCLQHLIVLFLRILQSFMRDENWEAEKAARESKSHCETWKALCLSLKRCIYDPQNKTNQHQVNTIIPKSISFLGEWLDHAKENGPLKECVLSLTSLLVQVLFHNQLNQTSFAVYSGIEILIRGTNKLQELANSVNDDIKNKLIRLLNAAISGHKQNCIQAVSMGGMHVLLELLSVLPDNKKFPVLVTLTHLVQKGDVNDKQFVKTDGLAAVALATANMDSEPDQQQAATRLLKVWAEKISTHNSQHKDLVENDQPFKDNLLLKLKTATVFEGPVESRQWKEIKDHTVERCKKNNTLQDQKIPDSVQKLGTILPKESEDESVKKVLISGKKKRTENIHGEKNKDSSLSINSTVCCNTNENEISHEQNKYDFMFPSLKSRRNSKKETIIPQEYNKDYSMSCSLPVQGYKKEDKTMLFNKKKKNAALGDEIQKVITFGTPYRQLHVQSSSTFSNEISQSYVSDQFQYDGSTNQSTRLPSVGGMTSNQRDTLQYDATSSYYWQSKKEVVYQEQNESSGSEYASALDASFDSSSSTFSSCIANAPSINDVSITSSSCNNICNSRQKCSVKLLGTSSYQNESEMDFDYSYNASSNESYHSSNAICSKSYKINRDSYENFISKIRGTDSDLGCKLVTHSTPRMKIKKCMDCSSKEKFSVGRNSEKNTLSYQNISLPSTYSEGFSAASLHSSTASSRHHMSQEEINYLKEGAAKFGTNFWEITASFSATP